MRDLNNDNHWLYTTIHYQGDWIYEIEDELGKRWQISELSSFDKFRLLRAFMFELSANEIERHEREQLQIIDDSFSEKL